MAEQEDPSVGESIGDLARVETREKKRAFRVGVQIPANADFTPKAKDAFERGLTKFGDAVAVEGAVACFRRLKKIDAMVDEEDIVEGLNRTLLQYAPARTRSERTSAFVGNLAKPLFGAGLSLFVFGAFEASVPKLSVGAMAALVAAACMWWYAEGRG